MFVDWKYLISQLGINLPSGFHRNDLGKGSPSSQIQLFSSSCVSTQHSSRVSMALSYQQLKRHIISMPLICLIHQDPKGQSTKTSNPRALNYWWVLYITVFWIAPLVYILSPIWHAYYQIWHENIFSNFFLNKIIKPGLTRLLNWWRSLPQCLLTWGPEFNP